VPILERRGGAAPLLWNGPAVSDSVGLQVARAEADASAAAIVAAVTAAIAPSTSRRTIAVDDAIAPLVRPPPVPEPGAPATQPWGAGGSL
jgi:hypothetical protein